MFIKKLLLVISIFATVLNMQAANKPYDIWQHIGDNKFTPMLLCAAAYLANSSSPSYHKSTRGALALGLIGVAANNLVGRPMIDYFTNPNDSKAVLYEKSVRASAIIMTAIAVGLLVGTKGSLFTDSVSIGAFFSLGAIGSKYALRNNDKK